MAESVKLEHVRKAAQFVANVSVNDRAFYRLIILQKRTVVDIDSNHRLDQPGSLVQRLSKPQSKKPHRLVQRNRSLGRGYCDFYICIHVLGFRKWAAKTIEINKDQ